MASAVGLDAPCHVVRVGRVELEADAGFADERAIDRRASGGVRGPGGTDRAGQAGADGCTPRPSIGSPLGRSISPVVRISAPSCLYGESVRIVPLPKVGAPSTVARALSASAAATSSAP